MSQFPRNSAFAVNPDTARSRIASAQASYWRDLHVASMREASDLRHHAQRWVSEVSDMAFDLGEDDVEIEAIERRMQDLVSSMDRVLRSQDVQASADHAGRLAGLGEDYVDKDTLPLPRAGE